MGFQFSSASILSTLSSGRHFSAFCRGLVLLACSQGQGLKDFLQSSVVAGLAERHRAAPAVQPMSLGLPGHVARPLAPVHGEKPWDPCGEGCLGSQAGLWMCFL